MLSPESAAVIRATLPAVGGALDDITTRPDVLLGRIAHKHAAVGVTDEQYTIVHKYLFAAIADVLGDAVTPEVAAAWDEVYWLMAGALIAQEARLYLEALVRPDQPWRRWTVVERREETPDAASILLRPADGAPAPRARAGQYVSVRVRMPDGVHQLRQYSISSAPGDGTRRITVQRVRGEAVPDGEVSNLLLDTVRTGDELTLSAPFGDVLHADRSPADHALRADIHRLVEALPEARSLFWYERPGTEEPTALPGIMSLDDVDLPKDASVYLCGPLPFMRAVRDELLRAGVSARDITYEVFGPDLWLADATG
ncbi:FAD-binding oxidoreductase [Streptomyces abikoensis]|uniref:FAD-binding oxidoreductase n=1 Tax=Streptomyces abikoensis TaxID=97398 RepID=UPI0036CA9090